MITLRRRPKGEPAETHAGDTDTEATSLVEGEPARTHGWTGGPARGVRLIFAAFLVLLVASPIVTGLAWISSQRADSAAAYAHEQAQAGATVADTGEYWVAASTAEQVVQAWLGATREDSAWLTELIPTAKVDRLPSVAPQVSQVAAVSVDPPGPTSASSWTVVVGATVTVSVPPAEEDAEAEASASRQFFQVSVFVDPVTIQGSALALPAVVGDPGIADAPVDQASYTLATSSEIPTTVGEFLAALLAGAGDVNRYVTPGQVFDLPAEQAYTAVRVLQVRSGTAEDELVEPVDGATTTVVASVELTRLDGESIPATYVLDLTSRDGRWEITAMTTPALSSDNDEQGNE